MKTAYNLFYSKDLFFCTCIAMKAALTMPFPRVLFQQFALVKFPFFLGSFLEIISRFTAICHTILQKKYDLCHNISLLTNRSPAFNPTSIVGDKILHVN